MLRPLFIAFAAATASCSGCGQPDATDTTTGGNAGGAGTTTQCADGWCVIPATVFIMGSPEGEFGRGAVDEDQVEVTLTRSFLLQQTELTLGQTRALGWPDPTLDELVGTCDSDDCPAGDLTIWEAFSLANELSRRHDPPLQECYLLHGCSGTPGLDMFCESFSMPVDSVYDCEGYRLPTEAEWEHAARAGTTTATYHGELQSQTPTACHDEPTLEPIGWHCYNSRELLHPVGEKMPNAFGLHDMLGNLQEWTHNRYHSAGYPEGPLIDPFGGDDQTPYRAARGGNVWGPTTMCRSAGRFFADWTFRPGGPVGVRLARTVTPQAP